MKNILLLLALLPITVFIYSQNQTINGNLHVALTDGGNLRIGKIGDFGNREVPIGGVTAQYNLDFSGYRDVAADQIGARIAAIRFNCHVANKAYVQSTALAFFTNPIATNSGTTDLVERMRISPGGNVGIGISNPTSKLEVNGVIRAKEVKIEAANWPDYVFSKEYNLPALSEVENHINEHKHLPNIPSEAEVKENGVDIGDFQIKLLQKIEELTLYTIQQQKQLEEQGAMIRELQSTINNNPK